MGDESVEPSASESPDQVAPGLDGASTGAPAGIGRLSASASGVSPEQGPTRRRHKRRSWLRWVANLMIIAGVLSLPGYFLGSCGYTWLQQRDLRQKLEEISPQLTVSVVDIPEVEFVSVTTTTSTAPPPSATEEQISAAEAAVAAAKAAQAARLAAFRAAADAFAEEVGGQRRAPLGRVVIPSIDVDVIMLEGTSKSDLKEGPGHWEETPFPGQGGNFVVSGHRTTYGAPFFKLGDVELGDEIQLIMPYVVARYIVTKNIIVYPDEVETVRSVGIEQVSLAACHPLYSAKQRIVVIGDLVSFKLVEL